MFAPRKVARELESLERRDDVGLVEHVAGEEVVDALQRGVRQLPARMPRAI